MSSFPGTTGHTFPSMKRAVLESAGPGGNQASRPGCCNAWVKKWVDPCDLWVGKSYMFTMSGRRRNAERIKRTIERERKLSVPGSQPLSQAWLSLDAGELSPCKKRAGSALELAMPPTPISWELALTSEWQDPVDNCLGWNDSEAGILEGSPEGSPGNLLNNEQSNQACTDKALIPGSPEKHKYLHS